jgi:large subunit ribosomal protein L21
MNYAIIEINSHQFWVESKKYYIINHLPLKIGTKLFLKRVLLINQNKKIKIGHPYLNNVKIEAIILDHFEGKKFIVYKMKPKKKYRRKTGFRPKLTKLLINSIKIN